MKFEFPKEEQKTRDEIRTLYNSGQCDKAVKMSEDFLMSYPNSFLAKYSYAVMSGDFASDLRHSVQEKKKLLQIAKKGIAELFNDPNLVNCPEQFQKSVKNEYFWFYEMPDKQYQLGIDCLETDAKGGHYSACVGASMMALNLAKSSELNSSQEWAKKSVHHFQEFEKLAPHWYNINYFSAQAFACLGQFDEAISVFKDMFRKQGNEVNQNELDKFLELIADLEKLRKI